ncbi:MAG TPA: hypothetical protein VGN81_09425 [Pseudonocardiaceae bacterium]|jgi:hypothetical protein
MSTTPAPDTQPGAGTTLHSTMPSQNLDIAMTSHVAHVSGEADFDQLNTTG